MKDKIPDPPDRPVSAEAEVENISRRLIEIVESSEDAIIGLSLDGSISCWNKGAEKIYGYTSDEVVGKDIAVLMANGSKDSCLKVLEKVRQGEAVECYETRCVSKDGKVVDVSMNVSPIKDASGQVVRIASIGRDISRQKKEQKEFLDKMHYLEVFQKAAIDREMKLIELKEKIKELQDRIIELNNGPKN